jgi:hypothetical protein
MSNIKRLCNDADLDRMSAMGIYLLMQEHGADVFGLWSAEKADIVAAYKEQLGIGC